MGGDFFGIGSCGNVCVVRTAGFLIPDSWFIVQQRTKNYEQGSFK